MIVALEGMMPVIDASCFVAPSAVVVGDVRIGAESGIWYGAVVRGDMASVSIGARSNVQDLAVLHVDASKDLSIGDDVTLGHRAIVHACTVRDRVLVGMGAVIMNGAEIGEDSIVGAGAVVTEGYIVPPRSLVLGMPGRVKRELTPEEILGVAESARVYVDMARRYLDAGLASRR